VRPAPAHGIAADENDPPPQARSGDGTRTRVALFLGVLVFPLLVVVAYFATRTLLSGPSALEFAVSQGESSATQVQSFNNTSLQQVAGQLFPSLSSQSLANPLLLNLPTIDFAGVLLVVVVAVVVLIAWRGLSARRLRTAPFEDAGNLIADNRRKLTAILDAAVARLNTGSAYRETVIQCYKMISELLEERSEVDGRVLTAREFRARVSEKLKIDSPYLAQVTELFEIARYSEQEITMGQSQEAVACLSNLSASLKQPVLSVSGVK
jgi:hypothetical protein